METTETKWRRERRQIYEKLERSAENGLDRDAVLASRHLFAFDGSGIAVPKQFTFQHEDDAVTVVCAEIPRAAALQWSGITRDVLEALQGEPNCETGAVTGLKDVYVSDQDIMHVTLFYTSHPDDLAPRNALDEPKSERLRREISLLRELATQFEPVHMVPVKVVLAASGAILLLLQCVQGDDDSTGIGERDGAWAPGSLNTGRRAEFSVDLLRQVARGSFPFVSDKSPNAIIHSTLARVLSPDAFDGAALTRVREVCRRISKRLESAGPEYADAFVVSKLWYVDETHFICPTGHTTTVSLGTEATGTLSTPKQQKQDELLDRAGSAALNREAVRKTRQHFTPGAALESKPYEFPNENDGVALICAPIPAEMAERCHAIGKQLTDLLPREPETSNAVACVTRRELMHVTLFHTSHPGDLAPNARLRFPQDVAQLKTMCSRFAPFRMAPVKVLMASSGAIIMLFQCLPAAEQLNGVVNEHAEFSVDHVRRVAKETFSFAPKTDTRVIIHATLRRVLSPDVSEHNLDRLRAQCDAITAELAADPQPALFDKLWFVEETHHLSPQGPKTDVPLLGGVHKAA
ncbi:hypothetical protein PF008_g10724 [Phytophthora fragariae]|uniref:Uncharacterized protein n=2 Tax=Phytophthora fragariae TaxID=53985 RepID=A0A6G0RSW0_9STRA|nr:hypothetical protein PF008_g10724 [Phytophthora fragariae]